MPDIEIELTEAQMIVLTRYAEIRELTQADVFETAVIPAVVDALGPQPGAIVHRCEG